MKFRHYREFARRLAVITLFLSCGRSRPREIADVSASLWAAGFEALFVDFDPDVGISAARDWERELYTQLRRSDGVIFWADKESADSRWRFVELSLARSLGKPVFPLRVERD